MILINPVKNGKITPAWANTPLREYGNSVLFACSPESISWLHRGEKEILAISFPHCLHGQDYRKSQTTVMISKYHCARKVDLCTFFSQSVGPSGSAKKALEKAEERECGDRWV
jgi:hypothetical protein